MNILTKLYDAAFLALMHVDILINQALDFLEEKTGKRRG